MDKIVDLIDQVLMNAEDPKVIAKVKKEVNAWMQKFPLYKK